MQSQIIGLRRLRFYFRAESLFGLFRKRLGRFKSASYIMLKVNLSSGLLNIVMESHLISTISVCGGLTLAEC